MKLEILYPCFFQSRLEAVLDVLVWLPVRRVKENIGHVQPSCHRLENAFQVFIEGYSPALAILCFVQGDEAMFQINMLILYCIVNSELYT